jgi:nicotinamidase-related amidase
MATIRKGNKTALMVVDVQVGVIKNAWEPERIVHNICIAVEKARSQGIPVIWVQHSDDELKYQSPEWELAPELAPLATETRLYKHFNSSFEETRLEEILSRLEVSHIVLAGAATNWCIRATAYGALDRGYDLTLIKDAHTTENMDFEDGVQVKAEHIIRDLNVAMNWLSYPGRVNRDVAAKDIDFSIPAAVI